MTLPRLQRNDVLINSKGTRVQMHPRSRLCELYIFNGGKIVMPIGTKTGTTVATYVATDLMKHKVVPLRVSTFLKTTKNAVLSYAFAIYAWGNTVYSAFCSDPVARANGKGYILK